MSRRGFTLVELVLVLALAAVLAALAAPRFATAQSRYRAGLAADRVAREIEHARQRAVVTGAAQSVTFMEAKRAFTIDGMRGPDMKEGDYLVDLAAPPYSAEEMTSTFAGDVLRFNGYGVPEAGGVVKVVAGGYECEVTVQGVTGVVSVSVLR